MTLTLALTLLAVFIVTEGFFSGSELAMVSADRLRLKARAEEGDRGSKLVLTMLSKPSHLLGTCHRHQHQRGVVVYGRHRRHGSRLG